MLARDVLLSQDFDEVFLGALSRFDEYIEIYSSGEHLEVKSQTSLWDSW
jgi:hypothetical protein